MSQSSVWLELQQVEARLCTVAAEQLGVSADEVKPESRFIEDLNCDSLDLIELIMETEDEFGITIPETPSTPVGKLIFTRQPFRIRDLAEFAFLNQGTGSPVRGGWRKKPIELPPATESGFTQLGGKVDASVLRQAGLHERLDGCGEFPCYRRTTDGMVCVQVPASSVEIGCDDSLANEDEKPRHQTTLSSFLMDVEPVSVTAFCRFLNSIEIGPDELRNSIALPANDDRQADRQFETCGGTWQPRPGAAMQPVILVSWNAADAYSRWANGVDWRERDQSFLPTEAQWECAADGAFDEKELVYAGIHQRGQAYQSEGLPMPRVQQPYGQSRFGLRHMSGTIWHWCRDWYSPDFYRSADATQLDPIANIPTGLRSERGGSWVGPIELCRPSYRRGRNPEACGRCLGFRCVGSPPAR
ncbi:SUMF1/EgtB/PvdO family nonheme iron enzyme [Roseiconus nitratireducens]|uniref:Acyl carrier protein n=1 Tax=Roseiconus nitratireducens TaxID=2605748 RepID=A0A5M6CUI2_9BACT|nr:SUMF1/EgtB/PvdO family nonheme iron enzyme [Roseiconus nitratireducens]KAA5538020.1 SUMF1/EgtB/PvdO family nonheme iron enzyme [Roseiconus nitratireducens]